MARITDSTYPLVTALDADDIALVVEDGAVARANQAAMFAWFVLGSGGDSSNFLCANGTWTAPLTGGGAGHASYTFNATLTEPPAVGQIRMNNANQLLATKVWVSQNDVDGLDVSLGLIKVLAGHQIYIQDYDDASKWVKYNVTAVSDDGAYYDFTVTHHSGPGGVPTGSGAAGRAEFMPVAPGTVGVPPGGAVGQALTKSLSDDFAVGWTVVETPTGAQAKVDAHVNDTTAAHAASAVAFTPTGTIAATDVQAAIAEVASEATGGGAATGTKMTDLTAQTGAGLATTDIMETVDISDTTMHASGTNKKLAMSDLITFLNNNGIGSSPADASTTVKGIVELATTAEASGLADTVRAVTPAGLSAAFLSPGASAIAFTPTGSVAATNVQAAIAEVAAEVGTGTVVKLSELTAMGASAATGDLIEVIDISDTTMAASGTNKKLTLSELVTFLNANGILPAADSVTNAILAPMPTLTLKGNNTGSTADPLDLTVANVKTMLAYTLADVGAAPVRRTIVANTGTSFAPVVATHENVMVTMSNASAQTITLPSDGTSNFPIGAETDYLWLGVGQPVFAAGGGATVNSESSWLKMRARYTAVTAKKIAANTWVLLGALAA